MTNTCIDCIHKDVCYKYRLNYVIAREGTCSDYVTVDLRSAFVAGDTIELTIDKIDKEETK